MRRCASNETGIRRTASQPFIELACMSRAETSSMKRISLIVALSFLFFQGFTRAQTRLINKLYADANVGLFVASYDVNLQLQGGLGYLITRQHGLGVSYRMEDAGNSSSAESITGIGLNYRYAAPWGLIVKAGIGKVLSGGARENNSREFVLVSSKAFKNVSLAYQLPGGITFGLYYTHSPELLFDTYLPAWDLTYYPGDDPLVYEGTFSRSFHNYGVTVGFALPRRERGVKD